MKNRHVGVIGWWLLAVLVAAGPLQAQQTSKVPARIVGLLGRTHLHVGEDENFRVRLVENVAWPVEYEWDFGDGGVAAQGNNVVHNFSQPGRYTINVSVRNRWGRDQARMTVTVVPAPVRVVSDTVATREVMASAKKSTGRTRTVASRTSGASLRSSLRVTPEQGGYTWIVATHLDRVLAEAFEYQLRQDGYRTAVIVDDSGRGSLAYRIAVGQFASEREALAARRRLPVEKGQGVWLMPLAESH